MAKRKMTEIKLENPELPQPKEVPSTEVPILSTFEEHLGFIHEQFSRIIAPQIKIIERIEQVRKSIRGDKLKEKYDTDNMWKYRMLDGTIASWAFGVLSVYNAFEQSFAKIAFTVLEEICEAQKVYSEKEALERTRQRFCHFIEWELTTNNVYKYRIRNDHIYTQVALIDKLILSRIDDIRKEDNDSDGLKDKGIVGYVVLHIPTGDYLRENSGFQFTTNIKYAELFKGPYSAQSRIWRYDPNALNPEAKIFDIVPVYMYQGKRSIFPDKETPENKKTGQ